MIAVIIILKDPSCIGVSPVSPFFISMYELPHIIDRIINVPHFLTPIFKYLFILEGLALLVLFSFYLQFQL